MSLFFEGGQSLSSRVCMRDKEHGAVWLEPDSIGCGKLDEPDLDKLAEVCKTKFRTDIKKQTAYDDPCFTQNDNALKLSAPIVQRNVDPHKRNSLQSLIQGVAKTQWCHLLN